MIRKFFLAAMCTALVGCQTTSGGGSLEDKYRTAVTCIQSHVNAKLTPKKETPDEVRSLVYAGMQSCEPQLVSYIRGVYDQVMFDNNWSSLKKESQENISTEIMVTTSVALQEQYNKLEAGQ